MTTVKSFTLYSEDVKGYVRVTPGQAVLTPEAPTVNNNTILYYDSDREVMASLSEIDAANGKALYVNAPVAVSWGGISKMPITDRSAPMVSTTKGTTKMLLSDGNPLLASVKVGKYSLLPNGHSNSIFAVETTGPMAFIPVPASTMLKLCLPDGKTYVGGDSTGKFFVTEDVSASLTLEVLNGMLIVQGSYNNSASSWKDWTVELLAASPTGMVFVKIKVCQLPAAGMQTINVLPSGLQICSKSGRCLSIGTPTADGKLPTLPGSGNAASNVIPKVLSVMWPSQTVAIMFPAHVGNTKKLSIAEITGIAIASLVVFIIIVCGIAYGVDKHMGKEYAKSLSAP